MRLDKGSQPLAEINMVPFIDILLVLLVIVLMTAPLLMQHIPIALPRTPQPATVASQAPEPPALQLGLDAGRQLYWDASPMASVDLPERLRRALQSHAALRVQVYAERTTPYEAVAQLLAQLHHAGLDDIRLVTESNLPAPSATTPQPSTR